MDCLRFQDPAELSTRPVSKADLNSRQMEKQPILFFDGVCGLCNRTVDFVLQEDRDRRFLFAPLQGETFKAFVKDHPELSTVDSAFVLSYTAQGWQLLMRGYAIFYILRQLPHFRAITRTGRS